MKKILFAIAFVMMMVIANAQSDGWFKSNDGGFMDRGDSGSDPTIALPSAHGYTDDQTTPLGSGLIILGALGAGYAVARRKREEQFTVYGFFNEPQAVNSKQ